MTLLITSKMFITMQVAKLSVATWFSEIIKQLLSNCEAFL